MATEKSWADPNADTARLSPEMIQVVQWEGHALSFVRRLAEEQPAQGFDDIWYRYCADNPVPNFTLRGYDPELQDPTYR